MQNNIITIFLGHLSYSYSYILMLQLHFNVTVASSSVTLKKKPDRSVFVHKLWLKTRVKSAKVKHVLGDTQTSVSVSNVGRVGAVLLQMLVL